MKKKILGLGLFLMTSLSYAQNGLEEIIVEKYYISDAADSVGNDAISALPGALPVGSVTYRIYADMLPSYKFQAAYGIKSPLHLLKIATTTLFFNNEDRGALNPNGITVANDKKNTVMLDSWLSVGGAASGKMGILKADDTDGSVGNADGILQSANAAAGIPVKTNDGMIAGTPVTVTAVGIDSAIAVFDNQNDGTNGPVFSTNNGSWAALTGATGPTADNRVLIAQITTNGVLSFELNIQIGTPAGGVQNYVAKNPTGSEIQIPSLIYASNIVGVNEAKTVPASTWSIYPNPANDVVAIELTVSKPNVTSSYTIYDLEGNVLVSKDLGMISGKHLERVDMSSFAPGMYFIQVSTDGVTSTKKIMKAAN